MKTAEVSVSHLPEKIFDSFAHGAEPCDKHRDLLMTGRTTFLLGRKISTKKNNKNRGREEQKKIIFNLIMAFLNSDKLRILLPYEMRS